VRSAPPAFWRSLWFPNLVLARAAKAKQRRLRLLEEWKREELQRTPFAILDQPPLRSGQRGGGSDGGGGYVEALSRLPYHFGPAARGYSIAIKGRANTPKPGCGWSALGARDPFQCDIMLTRK
jgi:hypothetical protein